MSASGDEEHLTPYQGKKRTFGLFKCEDCNIAWSSAWSWANTSQQCKECLQQVYPHRQFKLKRGKGNVEDAKKRHKIDLCGKCKILREPCTNHHPTSVQPEAGQGAGRKRRRRRRRNAKTPAAPAVARPVE